MNVPYRLKMRLEKIGLNENIYDQRARKCILSKQELSLEKVPWYEHAYFIPENFASANHLMFDPVSLVPCLALNPKPHEKILDMCAAPGTKTYILSFLTHNEAGIVANDINKLRLKRLKFNVEKFRLSAVVINSSGRKIEGTFDKILVDAPCSGEGMVNKSEKLFRNWSENSIRFLARKQKKLITHAFRLLADGGTLVYSTCTFEPEENEAVVDFLLKKTKSAKLEEIDTRIKHENGLTEWAGKQYDYSLAKCMRIYPSHNQTGGFFAAKIRKAAFS